MGGLEGHWWGYEVWHVSAYSGLAPHDVLAWSRDQVLQAYYYLRMRDLRDPRQ
jgi:hypothetical protein